MSAAEEEATLLETGPAGMRLQDAHLSCRTPHEPLTYLPSSG